MQELRNRICSKKIAEAEKLSRLYVHLRSGRNALAEEGGHHKRGIGRRWRSSEYGPNLILDCERGWDRRGRDRLGLEAVLSVHGPTRDRVSSEGDLGTAYHSIPTPAAPS